MSQVTVLKKAVTSQMRSIAKKKARKQTGYYTEAQLQASLFSSAEVAGMTSQYIILLALKSSHRLERLFRDVLLYCSLLFFPYLLSVH